MHTSSHERANQFDCLAENSIIEAVGWRTPLWKSSGVIPAKPFGSGLRVTLDIDSALLHDADYIVTIRDSDGDVIYTYLFRVSGN